MKIPKLTTRQFAIMSFLCPSAWGRIILTDEQVKERTWHRGEALRKKLRWNKSLPTWFQNMWRLEVNKMVKGRYVRQDIPGGGVCKAREYRLTKKGEKALQEFDDFCDYFGRVIHQG